MVSDQQLAGNWAEQFVAERLAALGCLVRHVPQGHDVGIDLYCETTVSGTPWLHFWFQVKARADISGTEDQIRRSIDVGHLNYWHRQPIPVFVVYLPSKPTDLPPMYVCPTLGSNGTQLTSQWKLTGRPELKNFLEEILPLQAFLWDLQQGKVGFIQPPSHSYTARVPVGYAQMFEAQIHRHLDLALCRLSEDILKTAYDFENLQVLEGKREQAQQAWAMAKPYMQALEVIVRGRGATGFFEHVNIGVMAELDGDVAKARDSYKAAIDSIDGDHHISQLEGPEKDFWKTTRAKIETHFNRASSQLQETHG